MKMLQKQMKTIFVVACTSGLMMMSAGAQAAQVTVTIENLAPVNGNYFTPVWVGFHNGGFDIFDLGIPAAGFLERLAEDGNTAPISTAFSAIGSGVVQGTILGPGGPFAPGETASMTFDLDGTIASSWYFSYAAMIIPSNDAFIANENPIAYRIFDNSGNFLGADFFVTGSMVLDAGTEVNDELPLNTAFLGQVTPDTGVAENGVVGPHPGFLPDGNILNNPQFANADFTREGYPVAHIRVAPVPLPASLWLISSGLAGLIGMRRKFRS